MSAADTLPLLAGSPDAPVAWHRGRPITRGALVAHARGLMRRMPDGRNALVLCTDRYYFMVALAALVLAGRTALMPPSAAPRVIEELAAEHDAWTLDDDAVASAEPRAADGATIPAVDAAGDAVVLFTSGSTGTPVAQAKSWGEVAAAARLALARFDLAATPHHIVATVPAQHSYGLESSVLYAFFGPATAHAARPLYPADVRAALAAIPAPRVLVTTPVHLAACIRAGLDWPALAKILCATAPLERTLAQTAERLFEAPLYEIFGCSEAGALASRRTCTEAAWLPYDGMRVETDGEEVRVHGPHLDRPRPLADLVAVAADGRFELRGRKADEVKIGGKRINLAELNRRLLEIDGVEDGCFVAPDGDAPRRLAAVVVAPGLADAEIRARLAESVDPVFLPRPLVRVPALVRNASGKLPRAELLGLIEERAGAAVAGR